MATVSRLLVMSASLHAPSSEFPTRFLNNDNTDCAAVPARWRSDLGRARSPILPDAATRLWINYIGNPDLRRDSD